MHGQLENSSSAHTCDPRAVSAAWETVRGSGPLVAVSLHGGHELRPEVAALMAASDAERLREEDPATAAFGRAVPTRVSVNRSRFEVDLNRPRERAIYGDPADTWGITVWRELPLPAGVVKRSLVLYDDFYTGMEAMLHDIAARYGGFVLLDLHSYNHRRAGADAPPGDPSENPDVNIGTGSLDRDRWTPVVDAFAHSLGEALGPGTDIRENVRFRGGNLSRWVNDRFPNGCCLAIEFKKTYMDEWTGALDTAAVSRIADAVATTLPHLERALGEVIGP